MKQTNPKNQLCWQEFWKHIQRTGEISTVFQDFSINAVCYWTKVKPYSYLGFGGRNGELLELYGWDVMRHKRLNRFRVNFWGSKKQYLNRETKERNKPSENTKKLLVTTRREGGGAVGE